MANLVMYSNIHLGDLHLPFQFGGEFRPLWSESFAVPTLNLDSRYPRSINLNKPRRVIVEHLLVECGISKHDNIVFF